MPAHAQMHNYVFLKYWAWVTQPTQEHWSDCNTTDLDRGYLMVLSVSTINTNMEHKFHN
jgi:hypothetical protein